ncbi:DUF3895 domain-containing protein [Pseudalkalibacillus hwajinpoensis]|uniref:DUF3895 domain-containing protein n=1 Tax=Guptibacillus hwajinpoensis TaxID=208199 RepID=A0A4U1MKX8_9BACL|nr:DUF3895 domain-containing protein [Pseudalkalibacillus hwajinpoensis]TKD71334.1 DUF3895 domain-containing protein [Pseudalkalibacillus hwajinpoensis]
MPYNLTTNERDQLFQQLSADQQMYLNQFLKRGRKTVFANVIARDKGRIIPEGASDQEIEMLLDNWILDDFIDAGFVSDELLCECGRPLRYQYVVRHVKTGKVLRFGINHFEEHTDMSSTIVKEVMKGFNTIDYELDELLVKQTKGKSSYEIPPGMNIPKDINDHLELDLPLLDRQERRLNEALRAYREDREAAKRGSNDFSTPSRTKGTKSKTDDELQPAFDLFAEETSSHPQLNQPKSKDTFVVGELSFIIQEAIDGYIHKGIESTIMMCELLIKEEKTSNNRYSTGKPKIYFAVSTYLDSFVHAGEMTVEPLGQEDRIYRVKDK